jgi:hypothetical protein
VNIIGHIQAQIISFEKDIEEELSKMAKHSGINFSFYYGYIIEFDKSNLDGITPHRLIFSKNGKELIVLHYDLYNKNDNLFIVDGKGYTLYEIKKYIRNYFKNVSNINVKSNNK